MERRTQHHGPGGPIRFTDALLAIGPPTAVVFAVVILLANLATGARAAIARWGETPFWDITSADARPVLVISGIAALLIAPACARIFYRRTGSMLRTPRLMAILLAAGIGGLMFAGRLVISAGGTPAMAIATGGVLLALFGAMFLMSAGDARAMTMLGQDQVESLKRQASEQRILRRRMLAGRAGAAVRIPRSRAQVVIDLAHELRTRDVQVVAEMDDGEFMAIQARRPHAPVMLIAALLAVAGAIGMFLRPVIEDALAAQVAWGEDVIGALGQGAPVIATGVIALILIRLLAQTTLPARLALAMIIPAGAIAALGGITAITGRLDAIPPSALSSIAGGLMIVGLGVVALMRGHLAGRRAWGLTEELVPEHCAALDARLRRAPAWSIAILALIAVVAGLVLPIAAVALSGAAVALLDAIPEGRLIVEVRDAPGGCDVLLIPERAPEINREILGHLTTHGGRLIEISEPDLDALPGGPEATFTG